jgi:hypothetical protein
MRVFVDFEASSLADRSYPIEIGWVFEDGAAESGLIRPAPAWTDWDAGAEALHHISRADLERRGAPHQEVARRVLELLGPHAAYASAPSWDGKWLSVLLRAADLPRHAMRLKDSEEAHAEAAAQALAASAGPDALPDAVALAIGRARAAVRRTPAHRALADAEQERVLWLEVGRVAREMAEAFTCPPPPSA